MIILKTLSTLPGLAPCCSRLSRSWTSSKVLAVSMTAAQTYPWQWCTFQSCWESRVPCCIHHKWEFPDRWFCKKRFDSWRLSCHWFVSIWTGRYQSIRKSWFAFCFIHHTLQKHKLFERSTQWRRSSWTWAFGFCLHKFFCPAGRWGSCC